MPDGIEGFGKESGNWRRGRDLNPRYPFRYVRFRGGSFQPLTHLSASDDRAPLSPDTLMQVA
jgi:hypothetical protein